MLKLLAFVLPLGLDSFAMAAAAGAAHVMTAWLRLRISPVFVIFEGGMPLIGLGLGTALAQGIGQAARYLAGAAVIGIGAWMLLDKDEEAKASRLATSRGLVLVALGVDRQPGRAGYRIHHRPDSSALAHCHRGHRPPGFHRRPAWPGPRRQDWRTLA